MMTQVRTSERLDRVLHLLDTLPGEIPPPVSRFGRLAQHKWILAAGAILGLTFGFVAAFASPPLYRAETSIEVFERNGGTTGEVYEQVLLSHKLRKLTADRLLNGRTDPGQLADAASRSLVVRLAAGGRILRIATASPDPLFTARYANALASEFISERSAAMSEVAAAWSPRPEIEPVRVPDEAPPAPQRDEELTAARLQRLQKEARYRLAIHSAPDTVPEVADDTIIRSIRENLTDLRRQWADVTASFTPEYPRVRRLEAQIAALQDEYGKVSSGILERLRNEAALAREKERIVSGVTGAPALAEFPRGVVRQELGGAVQMPQFRILDPAEPSSDYVREGLITLPLGGALAGIACCSLVLLCSPRRKAPALRGTRHTVLSLRADSWRSTPLAGPPEVLALPAPSFEAGTRKLDSYAAARCSDSASNAL